MPRAVGIDLGMTNSAAAMEGGDPVVLMNTGRGRLTPLVVAFTKTDERLVGQFARGQVVLNSEDTLDSIQRSMDRILEASRDGVGELGRVADVEGLAVGADGVLYVADTGDGVVGRVGTDGAVGAVAGAAGTCPVAGDPSPATGKATGTPLRNPVGLARASDGALSVADPHNGRVLVVTAEGTVSTALRRAAPRWAPDGVRSPYGRALGADGTRSVADARAGRVLALRPATPSALP